MLVLSHSFIDIALIEKIARTQLKIKNKA